MAITALRLGYTRLKSLRPSVSAPAPGLAAALLAGSVEKWRTVAKYLRRERSDILV